MLVRFWFYLNLGTPGRLAGAERGSCVLQMALDVRCVRVRATHHAPRGPLRLLEHGHGLADIVERGVGVRVERHRVIPPHREREIIILSENASHDGHHFAHQRLGFFEAL